ncbi:exo-alpha-sialidase [Aquabacterium sp. OR-4]|uniref:exo-alpha-sialidase n=1 Tax=Aquabacterium sp. OR-4 TaxID=2978127 RepID=UPI0021B2A07F|nr:exo-alpha-sialidase [Aquabacterium sp. OR-4]MDT7837068.1 exo-alpha-sialidase [Aquabacterium sp. OR-4]
MTTTNRRQCLGLGLRLGLGLGLPTWAGSAAAQHGHGDAATAATATAPGGAAPKARRPRPALGLGAALAPDGALWVLRLDGTRLQLQRSTDAGASWSPAQSLDTGRDGIAADGESWPKLAFGPQGQAVITYTMPLSKPFTGAIRLLRSADGGASFAPPVTVHHDRQEITHRFDAVGFDARGRLHVVWIDKRDLELAKAAGRRYEGAAIYRVESRDGGASFGPDLKVADGSCECCRIALAPTPEGGLAALWRHVFPTNVRDHAWARLADDAPAPVRATLDGWVVAGCPHHGPGLAPAAAGGWHAVWFGQRAGVAAVRYGRLDAQGRPQGEARPLPDAAAEHAAVAALGERVAIVWRAFDGQAMQWRAWLSADGGRTFTLRTLGSSRGETDHPRLAQDAGRVLALWHTEDQGVRVVTLLPA